MDLPSQESPFGGIGGKYPADYISEGVDQTRGWFYTLHAISVMCYDSVAFKNVVSTGLVLDKNGQKMSKRLGNATDPFETIDKHGADVTRWYMVSNSQPWDNLKFDIDGLTEVRNKFFGTLYNTYNFFAMYANVDGFSYKENNVPLEERPEIDRWILSKLNSLIKEVNAQYADYEPTNAARLLEKFVDAELSNWYVRQSRRRFWKASTDSSPLGRLGGDKLSAYQTLYTCMEAMSKLMSPIAPFFSDWLYQNLNKVTKQEKHESVHLASFPRVSHEAIDLALEQRMDYAQRIASLILSLRKNQNIRVRQPLSRVMLPVVNEGFIAQIEGVKDLILAETNIKNIEFITDTSNIVKKRAKANFKAKDDAGQTLGARLGKDMKTVAAAIEALANEDIITIEKSNSYSIVVGEKTYNLAASDFDIISEDIPGWLVANDGALIVALDITLTDELVAEGTARELVNRIQNLRKDKGFDITDKINVVIENHAFVARAATDFKEFIASEVLAESLVLADNLEGDVVEMNEELSLRILVEKI
jgi:isoleucyl-tRNA synthetase